MSTKNTSHWPTQYVVSGTNHIGTHDCEHLIIGVHTTYESAINDCTEYILNRLETNDDLIHAMTHDCSQPKQAAWFSENEDGYTTLNNACRKDLYDAIRDELKDQHCYIASDGNRTFRFDIDEVGMKGAFNLHTALVAVTGQNDEASVEPHSFWSSDALVDWLEGYTNDYWHDATGKNIDPDLLKTFMDDLDEFGEAYLPIRDNLEMHVAVYEHAVGNESSKS